MKFIADLHVHSRYSAATSREADLPAFYRWARIKGIQLLATGDFTHPVWAKELKEQLVPCGNGLFELNEPLRKEQEKSLADLRLPDAPVRFLLCSEISSIYKKTGKTRKIHNLVCFDSFEKADAYTRKLGTIGNISYDGRPILGLDAKDLLSIVLAISPEALFIPAHIWTPWFSLFGSQSGFDAIGECFEDLSHEITALETGLSSDPAMNWRVSALDRYSLVSNSDAHSAPNIGREANLFDTDFSYAAIRAALKDPRSPGFTGTLEFFPEEGKYHHDGHRNCGVNIPPEESRQYGDLCPVCKKPLTIGVLHRVFELADRPAGTKPPGARPFESLVPLSAIVKEAFGSLSPPRLQQTCLNIVRKAGPEFFLLREASVSLLKEAGGPLLAEAVTRMREGRISVVPGFDGEFGIVGIFTKEERTALLHENSLFQANPVPERKNSRSKKDSPSPASTEPAPPPQKEVRDPLQEEIVLSQETPAVVLAGPGTGKTRILVQRVKNLLASGSLPASSIACLSFTVKAAQEIRERLEFPSVFAGTIHSFALKIIRLAGQNPKIIDAAGQELALRSLAVPGDPKKKIREWSLLRNRLLPGDYPEDLLLSSYLSWLTEHDALDFDGVITEACSLLSSNTVAADKLRETVRAIFVDEFQDISPVQYALLKETARLSGGQIFVTGDPDQSIYAFRGADPDVFAKFSSDFPEARRFSLKNNYRSSSRILTAAASLMDHSEPLTALRDRPGSIELCTLSSDAAEAVFAARSVTELIGGHDMIESASLAVHTASGSSGSVLSLSSIAILARTERQLRAVAECLDREGLPWKIRGGIRSLTSESGQLLIHLMRLFSDPEDPAALLFLSSRPETLKKISLLRAKDLTAGEFITTTAEEWNLSGLEEILSLVDSSSSVSEALERLLSPVDETYETSRDGIRPEAVSLLTLHAAKGLEFHTVLILGLNEGSLPHYHDPRNFSEKDLAEERRLFYVGLTRSAGRVILSRSADGQPSRFLDAVRPEPGKIRFRKKKSAIPPALFPPDKKQAGG